MPKLDGSELEKIYKHSEEVDKDKFAQMKSNLLLVVGEHYTRKGSRFWDRIKDNKDLSEAQKLRLTFNHIQNICRIYIGNILSRSANTKVFPNNPNEVQDQKTATMNQSVKEYLSKQLGLRARTREATEDFVHLGECINKIIYDTDMGTVKGYEQKVDDDGNPMFDMMGNPVQDENKPVMSGQFVVEKPLAFNILRDPEVQNIEDSPYLIERKMIPKKKAKQLAPGNEELLKDLDNTDDLFLVFDSEKANYTKTKEHVVLREHYYKPCKEYPRGYYYFCIRSQVIAEGELPFGIWPYIFAGFDKAPTSARYFSPIKQMKPYNVEINRCGSSTAQTQITLGDDKLILTNGSKVSQSAQLPGLRALTVSGGIQPPTVLPGRSGEQYLPWMQFLIDALYKVMGVSETDAVRDGQLDAYALLYHSARNRQKFSKYAELFEEFVVARDEKLLEMAKYYLDEDALIPMVGRSEMVNMTEFKNSEPNSYRIRVEPVSDDVETVMGKQLALNHAIQYAGSSLGKEDIARLMRAMPTLNGEEALNDITLDYDNAKNDILALERGEMPTVSEYVDNHIYVVNRLINRMKQADFRYLDPQIQQNFEMYKNAHLDAEKVRQEQLKAANADLIPSGGYLVTLDFYIPQANGETKRAKLPYEAINWLIDRLEKQGASQDQLDLMNKGAQAQMAQMGQMGSPDQNTLMGQPQLANQYSGAIQ